MAIKRGRGRSAMDTTPDNNTVDPAAQTFGAVDIPASGRIVAKPIPLSLIHFDLEQPRRTIPLSIRQGWDGSPAGIGDLTKRWHTLATQRLKHPIDAMKIVWGEEGLPESEDDDSLRQRAQHDGIVRSYLATLELAASIRERGLTNPITVSAIPDGRFLLETGERRVMAHHILRSLLLDKAADKIAAQTVTRDLFRQAEENNQRVELAAIERARQIALLIMEVYRARGHEFQPITAFERDQDFYAQVADGYQFSVRGDDKDRLLAASGVPSSKQLRVYRGLLRIDADLWDQADESKLSLKAALELADKRTGGNASGNFTTENSEENVHAGTLSTPDNSLSSGSSATEPDSPTAGSSPAWQPPGRNLPLEPSDIAPPGANFGDTVPIDRALTESRATVHDLPPTPPPPARPPTRPAPKPSALSEFDAQWFSAMLNLVEDDSPAVDVLLIASGNISILSDYDLASDDLQTLLQSGIDAINDLHHDMMTTLIARLTKIYEEHTNA
jgi:hypothetical protein